MATNKQTMDVIAMGLVPGKAKAEEREDVVCPVIEQIAQRAAEDFTDMAIELDMQGTLEMVNYLEAAQSFGSGREVVTLMKCIFLASGRKEAAKTLSLGGVGVCKVRSQSMKLPVALSNALENHSEVKTIALHLDADYAGRNAAAAIADQLRGRYEIRNEPPPVGKDCNDYLRYLKEKEMNRMMGGRRKRDRTK